MKKELLHIRLDDILADGQFNCREKISNVDVAALAQDIRELTLLQPVVVRRRDPDLLNKQPWLLIAGYRRHTAFKMLRDEDPVNYAEIPATEVFCTDLDALKMNFSENLHRKDLSILEEAHVLKRLVDQGVDVKGMSQEVKKSVSWCQIRLYLLDLPEDVQEDIVLYEYTQNMIMALWRARHDTTKLYDLHKKTKDKLLTGVKPSQVIKRERNEDKKVKPNKDEVLASMEKVAKICGNFNIITRTQAWTLANCTDNEFYADVTAWHNRQKLVNDVLEAVELKLDFSTIYALWEKVPKSW